MITRTRPTACLFALMAMLLIVRCSDTDTGAGNGSQTTNGAMGVVYLPDGVTPAPLTTVHLLPNDLIPALGTTTPGVLATITNESGEYSFAPTQAGLYNIEAARDTLGGFLDSVSIDPDSAHFPDIVLQPSGQIKGVTHLVGQSDTNQVRVTLYMPGTQHITFPAIGGAFSFAQMAPGSYQLVIVPTLSDYFVKVLDLSLSAGQMLDLDTIYLYSVGMPGLPTVVARSDTSAGPGDTVRLAATAGDSLGEIVEAAWDMGNTGTFTPGPLDTTVIVPDLPGTEFMCIVRVTDNDRNRAYDTVSICIPSSPPGPLIPPGENADLWVPASAAGLFSQVDTLWLGATVIRDASQRLTVTLAGNEAGIEGGLYILVPRLPDTAFFIFTNHMGTHWTKDLTQLSIGTHLTDTLFRDGDTLCFLYAYPVDSSRQSGFNRIDSLAPHMRFSGPNRRQGDGPGEGAPVGGWDEYDRYTSDEVWGDTLPGQPYANGRRWFVAGWLQENVGACGRARTDTVALGVEDLTPGDADFDDVVFYLTGVRLGGAE